MVEEKKGNHGRLSAKSTADPVLRNALRYTISAKEYEALHTYVLSRSRIVRRKVPSVVGFERFVGAKGSDGVKAGDGKQPVRESGGALRTGRGPLTPGDEYNVAAVRESLRLFLGTAAGLKLWEIIGQRFFRKERKKLAKTLPFYRSTNFRLSLSLSTILLLHRLLYRFFTRLRAHILKSSSTPFRQRNPRTSSILTSRYVPALGASLAGLALGIYPADQFRVTVAIYVLSRAAEFAYNLAEVEGWIWKNGRPSWWGSWMFFPVASGQLLSAFVFDRDCFPKAYGEFILKYSPQYIQHTPPSYSAMRKWPGSYTIVDSLAHMSKLHYPPFTSPILFPDSTPLLPEIAPITNQAHPLITSLSCAVLHPADPSCLRTYIKYWILAFPRLTRFFTLIFTALSLPSLLRPSPYSVLNAPVSALHRLVQRILGYSTFVAGSIGTSWAAICFFQFLLPNSLLPRRRFFLGGFLGGLWAWIVRRQARSEFLHSLRASMLSLWQVGKKRGWWKGIQGGDVFLFVGALAVVNAVFEKGPDAVEGRAVRRVLGGVRGEGWRGELPIFELHED